jgi:hypothetical protein
MGFEGPARQVQELFLAKKYSAAAAAVPLDFIDQTALLGDNARLRDRMQEFAEAGVTTLAVQPMGRTPQDRLAAVRVAAEVARTM